MEEVKAGQPERLDIRVLRQLPGLSRSAVSKLIADGKVLVNGKAELKSGHKVKADDMVSVEPPERQPAAAKLDLHVIYEDDDCVVVNKPAGVLTHSKGIFNPEQTVATWLGSRWRGPKSERAGIVHRLDRATSGVMICAKNLEAQAWLQKQFSQRKVKKLYQAVVGGAPKPAEAIIDMPIERNPKRPQTFRTGSNGKPAMTAYKVLLKGESASLLELKPTTGRTHQIRVHLSKIGHPIIGDVLYGGKPAERLFLHAASLEITLPNRQRETFGSNVPKSFKEAVL